MSKAVKILIGIVGLIVVALGGLFAYVAMLDFNQYKPMIAAQVRATTGRELEIKGKIAPQFSLTPTLAVDGVTLANAPWGEKRPMVSIERFEAKLQLVPLITSLGKRIVIDRVLLKGAEIWLETDDKGVGNWKLDVAPSVGRSAAPAAAGPAPDVVVMDVELQNAKLSFKPAKSTPTVLTLDKATMRGDTETSPRKVDAAGAYNKLKFEIAGQIGAVAQLMKGPFPVDLTLRMGDRATMRLVGQLREPLATRDYELRITAEMTEIGRAGDLANEAGIPGVQVPALGPLKLDVLATDKAPSGRVSLPSVNLAIGTAENFLLAIDGAVRDPLGPAQTPMVAPGAVLKLAGSSPDVAKLAQKLGLGGGLGGPLKIAGELADQGVDKLALKGFSIEAAGSDLAGDGVLAFGAAKPEITGSFKSKLLDITKLMPQAPAGVSTGPSAPGDGRVIPDTALPFGALDAANADLQLTIGALVAPAAKLQSVVLRAVLKGGALALKPFTFEMDGGRFALETAMNAKDRTLAQKVEVRNIEVGRILQERQLNDWFRGGRATLDINVHGKGDTTRAIAASLAGDAAFNMGPGEIGQALQRLLGQWLSAVSPALAQLQIGTSVRCAVYTVGFNSGVGNLRQGVVETQLVTARTAGNFNLGNEQLALRTQAGPIGVQTTGSFSRPNTSIDAASTALGVIEGAAGAAGGVVGGVLGAVTGQGGGGGGGCGSGGGSSGGQQQQPQRPSIPLPGGGSLPIPNPFRR